MTNKKISPIVLRDIPDDVHRRIVAEKSRIELSTGRAASNPQSIYSLIRRSTPKPNDATSTFNDD